MKPFTYLPKLDLFLFAYALAHADYCITDSGGLQEEAAYLGIPCLVHRMATERTEGLEEGASNSTTTKTTSCVTSSTTPTSSPAKPSSPTAHPRKSSSTTWRSFGTRNNHEASIKCLIKPSHF